MKTLLICDGVLNIDISNNFNCAGIWQAVDASGIPNVFDVSVLDPVILGGYFAAGLMSVGVFLVSMIPARFIIDALSKNLK